MKKICMVVILLCVQLLCCRQGSGIGLGSLALSLLTSKIDDSEKTGVVQTEQQQKAYNDLKKKVEQIKEFYNYKAPGLVSLNAEFNNRFQVASQFEEKYLYAALGGKSGSVGNLKKILVDIHESLYSYRHTEYFLSRQLYGALKRIGEDYFGGVIKFFYSPHDFLKKLKSVQDVQDLRELVVALKDLHEKWQDVVLELQIIIERIAGVCDEYLRIRGQAGKCREMDNYAIDIRQEANAVIYASCDKVCGETLCNLIEKFLTVKSEVEKKVSALVNS
ncbi:hypothetical protein [Borrelia persica]|uniref:hypothetical protein n=1 Tax=Borrelia persica TaxID=44448 RepID=UPI0004678DA0|nr:hypothetical protein [Borrelia persica]